MHILTNKVEKYNFSNERKTERVDWLGEQAGHRRVLGVGKGVKIHPRHSGTLGPGTGRDRDGTGARQVVAGPQLVSFRLAGSSVERANTHTSRTQRY